MTEQEESTAKLDSLIQALSKLSSVMENDSKLLHELTDKGVAFIDDVFCAGIDPAMESELAPCLRLRRANLKISMVQIDALQFFFVAGLQYVQSFKNVLSGMPWIYREDYLKDFVRMGIAVENQMTNLADIARDIRKSVVAIMKAMNINLDT